MYNVNPYKLIKISNINLHIGNGAKNELKKLCKQYQMTNPILSPAKIYDLMIRDNAKVPIEPEEIYKKKFVNLNELFNN